MHSQTAEYACQLLPSFIILLVTTIHIDVVISHHTLRRCRENSIIPQFNSKFDLPFDAIEPLGNGKYPLQVMHFNGLSVLPAGKMPTWTRGQEGEDDNQFRHNVQT